MLWKNEGIDSRTHRNMECSVVRGFDSYPSVDMSIVVKGLS